MKSRNQTLILLIATLTLNISCGDDQSEDMDTWQETDHELVYGMLNVNRIDQQQLDIANTSNEEDIVKKWKHLSYMRALATISTNCNTSNDPDALGFDRGSGVLVSPDLILTADHVVRAYNPADTAQGCSPLKDIGKYTIDLDLISDRVYSNNTLVDNPPPRFWLLKHRLHSLSLLSSAHYANDRIQISNKFKYPESQIYKSLAGKSTASQNIDVAFIASARVESEKSGVNFPPGIFFDWMHLPSDTSDYLTGDDKNRSAIGFHTNKDPDPNKAGGWIVNFSPPTTLPSGDTEGIIPLLSGSGFFRKKESSSTFGMEPCLTGYGNFCVGHTLDILRGSSGGPLIHGYTPYYKTPKIVGVFHSATAAGNALTQWTGPGTTPVNEHQSNASKASKATVISPGVTSAVNTNIPLPAATTAKESSGAPDNDCVGVCGADAEGSWVLFSCAEAFATNYPNKDNNDVSWNPSATDLDSWSPGNAAGLVGGPSMGVGASLAGSPSNIQGLGSLGLVCDQWANNPARRSYAEHWGQLKVVGLFRQGDALVQPDALGKINSLMRLNQSMPLMFQQTSPPSEQLSRYHHPLPMKLCPPQETLTGVKFILPEMENPKAVLGVSEIQCASVLPSSNPPATTWIPLNPALSFPDISGEEQFTSYIGKTAPSSGTTEIVKAAVCDEGQIVTGFYTYVPNDETERHNTFVHGVKLRCQGGLR